MDKEFKYAKVLPQELDKTIFSFYVEKNKKISEKDLNNEVKCSKLNLR
jgi:hypothetical protein